jgi:glycosyltransferase involved in cell wall biosynthesis
MNNIYFPLAAPFPTVKAYGVTTARTAQACTGLNYLTQILTPTSTGIDEYGNQYLGILPRWLQYLIERTAQHSETVAFRIQRLSCAILLIRIGRKAEKHSLFWCRDIQLVWPLLIFTKQNVIFESHNEISKKGQRLLKMKIKSGRLLVGTLTPEHIKNIGNYPLSDYVFQLPMAAPPEFFNPNLDIRDQNLIGYVGKGLSSGHDNGLLNLINHVDYCLSNDSELKFLFVGIENDFKKLMQEAIRKQKVEASRIHFADHVPHEEIIEFLSKMNYGIIPYPESSYNAQRFPIKAVEYSAARVNIIANNTSALENILKHDKATYFDIKNPESLYEAIQKIRRNPELQSAFLENSHEWAKGHTYQSRVRIVLREFAKVNGTLSLS